MFYILIVIAVILYLACKLVGVIQRSPYLRSVALDLFGNPGLNKFVIKNKSNSKVLFQSEANEKIIYHEAEFLGISKIHIEADKLFVMLNEGRQDISLMENVVEADGVTITIINEPYFPYDSVEEWTITSIKIENDPFWKVKLISEAPAGTTSGMTSSGSSGMKDVKIVPIMLWGGEPTDKDISADGVITGVSMFVTPNNKQIDFREAEVDTSYTVDDFHYKVARISYNEVTVTVMKCEPHNPHLDDVPKLVCVQCKKAVN